MPKINRIVDGYSALAPLRVTVRKARYKSPRRLQSPSVRVKCGCCTRAIEIYHDAEPTGDAHQDTLEIGGVSGTLDQWRQVLLPLLGMEELVKAGFSD